MVRGRVAEGACTRTHAPLSCVCVCVQRVAFNLRWLRPRHAPRHPRMAAPALAQQQQHMARARGRQQLDHDMQRRARRGRRRRLVQHPRRRLLGRRLRQRPLRLRPHQARVALLPTQQLPVQLHSHRALLLAASPAVAATRALLRRARHTAGPTRAPAPATAAIAVGAAAAAVAVPMGNRAEGAAVYVCIYVCPALD
jgi:hypothetical protein